MLRLLIILIVAFNLIRVHGFGAGAPEDNKICENLQPLHPYEPQKSTFPYTVTFDQTEVNPGQKIEIEIASPKSKPSMKFKGFMIQGRKFDWHTEKEFSIYGAFTTKEKGYHSIHCGLDNDTATHTGADERSTIKLHWTAPQDQGTYILLTTVVQHGPTFWVREPSVNITVI